MSDAKAVIPLKTHLKEIARMAKIRTNEQLVEFANATAEALEEMDGVKADKSGLEELKSSLVAANSVKADKSELNALKSSLAEMIAIFNELGLCRDADGDLAQK